MEETTLLFAGTLDPNSTPQSVHEVRFHRPCTLCALRIVSLGERPHPEISFEGQTPPTQVTVEVFGCEYGRDAGAETCVSLLDQPLQRQGVGVPSPLLALGRVATETMVDYVVIR